MSSDRHCIIWGLLASVAIHLLAILLIPVPAAVPKRKAMEELIEVDLFPLDYGALGYEAVAFGASEDEARLLSELDSSTIAFAQQLPLGAFIRSPRAAPADDNLEVDEPDLPQKRLPEMIEKTLSRLATSSRDVGRTSKERNNLWSLQPAQPKESVRLPDFAAPKGSSAPKGKSPVNVEAIAGPVSARSIVYRAPQSKVEITTPGSVAIKFWVQPDGAVSRIIFERKLDATLDNYSAQYVRALRFASLPEGKDYVEWGTITITFRPK